ncbi:hypothetical protein NBRC116492_15660 [Aurantivibrio infirmus]
MVLKISDSKAIIAKGGITATKNGERLAQAEANINQAYKGSALNAQYKMNKQLTDIKLTKSISEKISKNELSPTPAALNDKAIAVAYCRARETKKAISGIRKIAKLNFTKALSPSRIGRDFQNNILLSLRSTKRHESK